MFNTQNDYFEDLFADIFGQFDGLYKQSGITAPQYGNIYLKSLYVETGIESGQISFMDLEVFFDDNQIRYAQSVNLRGYTVSSYITTLGSLQDIVEDQSGVSFATTLENFAVMVDKVDFGCFRDMKPDAVKFGFDYMGDLSVFYRNTEGVKYIMINKDGTLDENTRLDRILYEAIPVISFIGYKKNDDYEDAYTDDSVGIVLYINTASESAD